MSKLNGKVAVVTGGNSGIGLATAKKFKSEGASVAIFGRNQTSLEQAAHELGADALVVQGDVRNLSDLDNLFARTKERFGRIDILVVNAGGGTIMPFDTTTEDLFDAQTETNFKGAYFTIQKALPLLLDGGSVTIVSSIANIKGLAGMSVYSATKAAVRSLARTLAAELAPKNIRVNTISPGPIETPLFNRLGLPEEQRQQALDGIKSMVPLQRFGTVAEMASVALFLASNDSSYINGADIAADGGLGQV